MRDPQDDSVYNFEDLDPLVQAEAMTAALTYVNSLKWQFWDGGQIVTRNGTIDPTELFRRNGWTNGAVILAFKDGILEHHQCHAYFSEGHVQMAAEPENIEWAKAFLVDRLKRSYEGINGK